MQKTHTSLHKSLNKLSENSLVQNIRSKIGEISANITERMPDLMGRVDVSGHFGVTRFKKNLLKKLQNKRGKFKLALESLGWGGLAELLESAFCGEQLNLWV